MSKLHVPPFVVLSAAVSPSRPVRMRRAVQPACAASGFSFRARLLLALAGALLPCFGLQTTARAQGFGATKKTITLERKLPAVVHLPGTAIDIRPVVSDPYKRDVAQALADVLLVNLQKNDTRLHVDKDSPDVVIAYSITTFQTPPPQGYVLQEKRYVNKRWVQVPVQYYKVTGELTIAYMAVDAHKKTLDADTITKKYAQDFQAGTNQAVGTPSSDSNESLASKFNPFKPKKPEENAGPPNAVQLRQLLVDGVVAQLVPRFVNTNEKIEVLLSRGKPFDEANKLAEKNMWERYLEAMETMTPLSDPAQDAYRLYNIGVADEALAYQAEDPKAAHKFLDDAAINYGKAIAAKPDEKYFLDPQTRIETALAYYEKLKEGANTKGDLASVSHGPATPETKTVSAGGGADPKAPLSNDDVIRMAKAGVDEDSIVAAIQDAPKVNFDLSPDGLISLAKAGIKGKIVTAMRTRAKQPPRRTTPPASN